MWQIIQNVGGILCLLYFGYSWLKATGDAERRLSNIEQDLHNGLNQIVKPEDRNHYNCLSQWDKRVAELAELDKKEAADKPQ